MFKLKRFYVVHYQDLLLMLNFSMICPKNIKVKKLLILTRLLMKHIKKKDFKSLFNLELNLIVITFF